MVLLQGPTEWRFLMSEVHVPLYDGPASGGEKSLRCIYGLVCIWINDSSLRPRIPRNEPAVTSPLEVEGMHDPWVLRWRGTSLTRNRPP